MAKSQLTTINISTESPSKYVGSETGKTKQGHTTQQPCRTGFTSHPLHTTPLKSSHCVRKIYTVSVCQKLHI